MSDPSDSAGEAPPVHVPILVDEVLRLLDVGTAGQYIDATVDGGGHTRAILDHSAPGGRVLALDRDAEMLARLGASHADFIAAGRLIPVHASFAEMQSVVHGESFPAADGILFDLGLSSYHLDRSGRGFAFARDEPLDMRFDPTDTSTRRASDYLARASVEDLTTTLRDFGEERFASRIARTLVAERKQHPIATTGELLALVERALPANTRWRAARHAARVFQGLRIAVNDELEAIRVALPQAWQCLAPGGRLVVLSFHSLEDRIVKRYFRERHQHGEAAILTKKPIIAGEDEVALNSRAASAKLRAIEKTGSG